MSSARIHPQARAVWARTTLHLWPKTYVLASLPVSALVQGAELVSRAAGFASLLLERDEVSVTVAEDLWRESPLRTRALAEAGPYRAITFDVDIDLGVIGYLAPAAERLAEAGVSIVPQCAYSKDHLLLREADLKAGLAVLESLIAECQSL